MYLFRRLSVMLALIGLITVQNLTYAVTTALSTTLNLNYVTETLQPGQYATLQGGGFTAKTSVRLQAVSSNGQLVGTPVNLPIVNRDANVLQVSIPQTFSMGLWAVWLVDDQGNTSVTRYINQATGIRFNTDAIASGNTLEVWGRNLGGFAGATSSVSFVSATKVTYTSTATESDPNHLAAIVPAGLTPGATYQVYVSNGLGGSLGRTLVNASLAIRKAGSDNLKLGVPWAADLTFVPGNYKTATNTYNVKTDARLKIHAYGDGKHDDEPAIQNAINVASLNKAGGGIVYLPAGTYLVVGPAKSTMCLCMQPHVVLIGAGPGITTIQAGSPTNPNLGLMDFYQVTCGGIADLTVQNVGQGNQTLHSGQASASNTVTEIFLHNVDFQLDNGGPANLSNIKDLLISDCTFESTDTTHDAIELYDDPYLDFEGNTLSYRVGRTHINGSDYAIIRDNVFNRDGAYSYPGSYESGGVETSFTAAPVISNNQFIVTAGAQGGNNDGEAVLTQWGGALIPYAYDTGAVSATSGLQLVDNTKSWPASNVSPANEIIMITSGPALGQWRYVTSMTGNKITLDRAWDFAPPPGSLYTLNIWTADRVFVLNNTFNNPVRMAVEFYNGAWHATVSGNTVTKTAATSALDIGGIWLRGSDRTLLPSETGAGTLVKHDVAWNNVVVNNTIRYSADVVMPLQICLAQIRGPLHGNGMLNTEVRNNLIDNEYLNAGGIPINVPNDGYWIGGMLQLTPGDMVNSSAMEGLILEGNSVINLPLPLYHLGVGLGQIVLQ